MYFKNYRCRNLVYTVKVVVSTDDGRSNQLKRTSDQLQAMGNSMYLIDVLYIIHSSTVSPYGAEGVDVWSPSLEARIREDERHKRPEFVAGSEECGFRGRRRNSCGGRGGGVWLVDATRSRIILLEMACLAKAK